MKKQEKQIMSEVTVKVEAYFNSLSYHEATIKIYKNGWKALKEFMEEHRMEFFDAEIGGAFITSILNNRSYSELHRKEKHIIRSTNVLIEYQTTGVIRFRSVRKDYNFEGEIGEIMNNFIASKKSLGMSEDTLSSNRLYLHRFLCYLNSNNISGVSEIDRKHILGFINGLGIFSKATIHNSLCSLRGFLRYLFERQHSDYNLTYLVPKSSYKKEARIPTTYTKEEIERLLEAVDRSSPKGKRDIAMILLAARLGLRASDICGLKFEHIHWEDNLIRLNQKKTSKKIELPLLVELGNAIIDYLKYGRPESDLPYIFLRAGQPYDRLEEPTLHSIVSFYLKRAAISDVNQKKHGPHALRHSLAGILLERKTPLPVISEVLGHSNSESTKTYLSIDLDSLRQCAMDVPAIQSLHYQEVN